MLVVGTVLRNQLRKKLLDLGKCIIIIIIVVVPWSRYHVIGIRNCYSGYGGISIGAIPHDMSRLSAGVTGNIIWPIGHRLIRRLLHVPRAIVIIDATSRSSISAVQLLYLLGQLLYGLIKVL